MITKTMETTKTGGNMKSVIYDKYMNTTYGSNWPTYGQKGLMPRPEPFKEARLRITQHYLQQIYNFLLNKKVDK